MLFWGSNRGHHIPKTGGYYYLTICPSEGPTGTTAYQKLEVIHLFSQNPATNTENSAQSRSEHIFMELTLFVYNINSQYFCIKSGLNYLRYKRYKRNETEGHIFFCSLNFHRNGIYILYINCYHHRKILYFTLISCSIIYWTLLDHNLPH